ncbi:MAG: cysteine hydrolase family protein [Candidatus Bipolaricaulota bacterium]|nr:cysteine hydrolase family protein [Candidatus Bipolaricaulota bacterium]
MMKKTALLVIDVQRAYMEPTPMVTIDGDDLLEKCGRLIRAARVAGVPLVYVQHMDEDSPADENLTRIHPAIAPRPDDAVVVKTFGSAFMKTDLEARLTDLDVKRLVICGLATFGCVNHTVLCALCRGYEVVVASDAHGTAPEGPFPPAETIRHFNATWGRAGAQLRTVREALF